MTNYNQDQQKLTKFVGFEFDLILKLQGWLRWSSYKNA